MTLKTLFAIPIVVILLVTLSLAGVIAAQGWSGLDRGKAAVEAVEGMRLLVSFQNKLFFERVMTNRALGQPFPLPEAPAQRLANARYETDQSITALIAHVPAQAWNDVKPARSPLYLTEVLFKLRTARAAADSLLAHAVSERTRPQINAVVPVMLSAVTALDLPLSQASDYVVAADPGLSGLLTMARIASVLLDSTSGIAAVLMPRYVKAEPLSPADEAEFLMLVGRSEHVTQLLGETVELAGPTDLMRSIIAALKQRSAGNVTLQLHELMDGPRGVADSNGMLPPQKLLTPWSEQASSLSVAIVEAATERVTAAQDERVRRLYGVIASLGAVMIATLASVALLRWRVIAPFAQLGVAITRIAAGDRRTPLVLKSGTREITEMVTAVETLRQAALVADAAATRQRMAALHRITTLRQALGIVQTVREPAEAMERGVARLSEGIDAAIALVTTATSAVPPTLDTAACAVRLGLAEMRGTAAELDATFDAAQTAQTDDHRPEAEIVAHILAIQTHIDRREAVVLAFIQPSLVALRDVRSHGAGASGPELRVLVSDQFLRIEATVATVSLMRAAVARAAAIVRDLPSDEASLAA
jgi:hypothetical protein